MPQGREKDRYPNSPQANRRNPVSDVPQVQNRRQTTAEARKNLGSSSRQAVGGGITPGQYTPVMENTALNMHGVNQGKNPRLSDQPDALGRLMNKGINKATGLPQGPPVASAPMERPNISISDSPAPYVVPGEPRSSQERSLLAAQPSGGRNESGGAWLGTPFMTPGPQQQPGANSELPEGMGDTDPNQIHTKGNKDGTTTHTMGTRGGPGGFAQATVPGDFKEQMQARGQNQHPAQQQLADPRSRYSFEGSPEDAAKFFAPVSPPALTPATQMASAPRSAQGRGRTTVPDNLDPRSGWGWNARQRNFAMQQQGDQFNDQMGMDAARLSLDAQKSGADKKLAREQLSGEQQSRQLQDQQAQFSMDRQRQIAEAQDVLATAVKGSPEYSQARQALAAYGSDGQQQSPKIHTSPINNEMGIQTGQQFSRYNAETGMMENIPVAGQGAAGQPMPIPTGKNAEQLLVQGQIYETGRGPARWDAQSKQFFPL